MKVLIFEGIATSGKSTIIAKLKENLPDINIRTAEEAETHIPIMEKKTGKHIEFFKSLVSKLTSEKPDVLIFDRLYLTQAFRAKCDLDEYKEVEQLLSAHSTISVFLKVDEELIANRILKASEHRGSDFFQSRGENAEEIAQYYILQQRNQLNLLEQSTLPYKIFNTTDHRYTDIVKELMEIINK